MSLKVESSPEWKVLIVEDDPNASRIAIQGLEVFARATRRTLRAPRVATTLRDAREAFAEMTFVDLVLLDLGLPDGWGHDFIERALQERPTVNVVVHTVFDDDANLFRALGLGASGYILKGTSPQEVADVLTDLDRGRPPLSAAVARRLLQTFREQEPPPKAPLTPKELEVVQYLARGLTNSETADCLGISAHTVSSHIKSVYRKLQVSSRAEMTGIAQRNGWVGR